MTHDTPHVLDVVALLEDLPDRRLRRGQVGTIVVRVPFRFLAAFTLSEAKGSE
ncbi:DUF4926 domain-containing protein [Roseiflexus castenholzii]|jgi:hypothetical protein|uniref:DUF4926 domain-containing protein n=1 Tax=Roseiflexus castenholzii TaxID=120962 RepID=UPI000316029F|nr:DUF4926 domain-containing protein [Roseiflexus castenholzii]